MDGSHGTDISDDVDGMFYGFVISAILLGISITQAWVYVQENQDRWNIRSFVTVLILLDVAETCCSTQILQHYLITNSGNLSALRTSTNVVAADFAITLAIMFLVHVFFITRIYILGRRRWYAALILVLSIIVLGLGICMFPHHLAHRRLGDFSRLRPKIQLLVFHALAAVTDLSVTIALSYTFSTAQKGYPSTKMLFRRLLVYTVSRGIMISSVQFAHIIMYLVQPAQFLFWISLHFSLSKAYVITTLFILNSRFSLRGTTDDLSPGSIRLTFASMQSTGHIASDRADAEDLSEFGDESSKSRGVTVENK